MKFERKFNKILKEHFNGSIQEMSFETRIPASGIYQAKNNGRFSELMAYKIAEATGLEKDWILK